MKLLFCEKCGDLVTPHKSPNFPKYCECRSSCCWWINPTAGQFGCWSSGGKQSVSVIGLHNGLLTTPFPKVVDDGQVNFKEVGCLQRTTLEQILENTANSPYKILKSLVVRHRPGFDGEGSKFFNQPPNV